MKGTPRLVASLLFASGASALVYQTAWQRSLRLVFGASTAASAAVLAVFLGGLGVGGVVLGRRAERSPRPLQFYGNLELGVAITAAASPVSVDVLGAAYLRLGGVQTLGEGAATALRLLITVLVVGPAVFLMGGTLPAAARAVEGADDAGRARLALVYGLNTLGAVVGALLGTFALFEVFGTRVSMWIGALVNALAAMIARGVGRGAAPVPVGDDAGRAEATPGARLSSAIAYAVAAGVGAAFLLLEIVWYRLLSPILGGSTYTFGLILAVALAGIGLGGFAYAELREERPASLPELATVTALEGVLVALPFALGDRIALFAAYTRPLAMLGFPELLASWCAVTLLVVFPAALVSGYQFPLLFALLGRGRDRVARQVGALYAFNTAGSIVGSLLGGFVLLPRLGAVGSARLVALTLLALALVTVAMEVASSRGRVRRGVLPVLLLAAAGVLLATREGPTAVWRHQAIGAGRADLRVRSRNDAVALSRRTNRRITWQADGVETGVALQLTDELAFVVDGKVDGAVYGDRATQAGSGLIGALVHGGPRSALVIGLGTGMTAGWLGALPGMERVDVAELEPSILEVARRASLANQDVLARPNVVVHAGDGRELVLTSPRRYDLVVSEPSNPYRAGIAALYTEDFYDAVAQHLSARGLFVQWVQGYEVNAETVRVIARTLRRKLPFVEMWHSMYGDILFLASAAPRTIDVAALRLRLAEEPYRTGVPRTLLVDDAEGILARVIASDGAVAELVEGEGPVNTDDHNTLDFAFARSVGSPGMEMPLELLRSTIASGKDRPSVTGDVDWDRVAELRARAWLVTDSDVPPLPLPGPDADARVQAVAEGCGGRIRSAFERWLAQGRGEPRDAVERYVVALGLATRGDPRALGMADALAKGGFAAEASLVRTWQASLATDQEVALAALVDTIGAMRTEALPLCGTSAALFGAARSIAAGSRARARRVVEELLAAPFGAQVFDESRRRTAQGIAEASGDAALCVAALGPDLEEPPWEEAFLETRLACLAAAGHPVAERAAADVLEFRAATAGKLELPRR